MNRNGNTACYHHRCQYWSAVVDQHLACPGAGRLSAPKPSNRWLAVLASRTLFIGSSYLQSGKWFLVAYVTYPLGSSTSNHLAGYR